MDTKYQQENKILLGQLRIKCVKLFSTKQIGIVFFKLVNHNVVTKNEIWKGWTIKIGPERQRYLSYWVFISCGDITEKLV